MSKPTADDLRVAKDSVVLWLQDFGGFASGSTTACNELIDRIASAIASEREKAAKKCEALRGDGSKPTDRLIGYDECAEAIRANKE